MVDLLIQLKQSDFGWWRAGAFRDGVGAWSPRKKLIFLIVAAVLLWAAIIAALIYLV